MPRGPKGEKRPADVIVNAVHVMRIATGEIEETRGSTPKRAKGGRKGGKARAKRVSPRSSGQRLRHLISTKETLLWPCAQGERK
jgi:hypothetical protein